MKSILLIEDDPFIADIYLTKLREFDFTVEVVNDGGKALKKIKTQKPHLILLDIVLPNINGWDILKKIKKDDQLKDIKIMILSNLDQKLEIEKGLGFGIDKYLVKAYYTPSEVVQEIKKILEK